jgi:hypothetical protein
MRPHAPRLDLGQVEDVVDQGEQVAARAQHAVEWFEVLLQCLGILSQHLGHAYDCVQGRAQLVAHVGEELRLVLARFRELLALVLKLAEQLRIADRQRRLRGEGLQQFGRAFSEFPGGLAANHKGSHDLIEGDQGND